MLQWIDYACLTRQRRSVSFSAGLLRGLAGAGVRGSNMFGCWVLCGSMLLCVVLSGCAEDAQKKVKKAPPPATVVLQTLEAQALVETRSFFGEVRAASNASLSPAESGRVLRVHVVEGMRVKQGQVLVELDDRLARVELSEAIAAQKQGNAQRAQAEIEVERYDELRKEHIVSELEATRKVSEADSLSAAAQGNDARVARGAEVLRRHRIVAPFDGVVTRRAVDPGDWLNAGAIALELLTDGRVEVDVQVPARMLDVLSDVRRVEIHQDGRAVQARVDSSVNALDPVTRTALLRLLPVEETAWLRAGASVTTTFEVERRDGLAVPRDALVYGVAGVRLFVAQDGKAQPIDVSILAGAGELVLVRAEELQLGAQVVVKGNERLRPGQAISEKDALVPTAAGPKAVAPDSAGTKSSTKVEP